MTTYHLFDTYGHPLVIRSTDDTVTGVAWLVSNKQSKTANLPALIYDDRHPDIAGGWYAYVLRNYTPTRTEVQP